MSSITFEPDEVERKIERGGIVLVLREQQGIGQISTALLFMDLHLNVAMQLQEILVAEIDRVLADAYDENEQRDRVARNNLAIVGGGTELPGEVR